MLQAKSITSAAVIALATVGSGNAAVYTWIQGGDLQNWNDPLNWDANGVPPQTTPGTEIIYSPGTSGNISSANSVNDSNKVTVGKVSWSSRFNMHSFGSWSSTATGWFIDTGTSDPAEFTFSNGGFMSNYYGTWNLNSDLLLSGTGAGGGMEVMAANDRVIGPGGFIVEAGTLRFNNTHQGEDYSYSGGVTVRNTGVVDINTNNEALGEGALTIEEGGQVQLLAQNLDNNADKINLVVLSDGAPTATNTTFLTGSPTIVSDFYFDLTNAGTTVGNQWEIVSATASYHDTDFSVNGWSEVLAGVWEGQAHDAYYQFDESTGILQVTAAVPEPGSLTLLGLGGLLIALRRFQVRRKPFLQGPVLTPAG